MALTETARIAHRAPLSTLARLSLSKWYDVWRTRRALDRLDAAALDDIGVSARKAHKEASKLIWDVAQTWAA